LERKISSACRYPAPAPGRKISNKGGAHSKQADCAGFRNDGDLVETDTVGLADDRSSLIGGNGNLDILDAVENRVEAPGAERLEGRGGVHDRNVKLKPRVGRHAEIDTAPRAARAGIEARVERAPTALVDILAAQDGLLVDALGPRVDVDVRSQSISLQAGEFSAELRSPLHSVVARGRIQDSRLVVDQVDGVVAQVGLGPLVSQRVVGKLVPTLVRVQKPQGAAPLALRVDDLVVPLDGDLRQLDARLRLELGEVQYSLLPGLEAWFPDLAAKSSNLPTIEVAIVDGVAKYERLPARIGGKELSFSGSYDLVDGKLNLSAGVPLSAFGKKVAKELDAVRDILPPDTLVPIELSGNWSSPKLRIKKQFLEDVVERAAQKALVVHGAGETARAKAAATALFSGDVRGLDAALLRDIASDLPSSEIPAAQLAGEGVSLRDLLPTTSLAASKREAREFLGAGAVSVNGEKSPAEARLTSANLLHGELALLRRGKKLWHVVRCR